MLLQNIFNHDYSIQFTGPQKRLPTAANISPPSPSPSIQSDISRGPRARIDFNALESVFRSLILSLRFIRNNKIFLIEN